MRGRAAVSFHNWPGETSPLAWSQRWFLSGMLDGWHYFLCKDFKRFSICWKDIHDEVLDAHIHQRLDLRFYLFWCSNDSPFDRIFAEGALDLFRHHLLRRSGNQDARNKVTPQKRLRRTAKRFAMSIERVTLP